MKEVRILTLWEPWASLIALKLKQYETRSWRTNYRGKLAIHAAKRPIKQDECSSMLKGLTKEVREQLWDSLCKITATPPYGCIVEIVDLSDCEKMLPSLIQTQSNLEKNLGNWAFDRFAWKLENGIALPEPIPLKGGQGLRHLTDETALHKLQEVTAL
jgi:hypothetical protein